MIYTDKIHLISDDIKELHRFAKKIGLNECYFDNKKNKGHPHYDLVNKNKKPLLDKDGIKYIDKVIKAGANVVSTRKIVEINTIRKRLSPPCKKHKLMNEKLGYVAWHDWADKKTKMGHKQKECPICGRYLFKCEF